MYIHFKITNIAMNWCPSFSRAISGSPRGSRHVRLILHFCAAQHMWPEHQEEEATQPPGAIPSVTRGNPKKNGSDFRRFYKPTCSLKN